MTNDKYIHITKRFESSAHQRFEAAQKKLEQLQKEFNELLAYFGEDKMESDEFFGYLFNFVFNFEVRFVCYVLCNKFFCVFSFHSFSEKENQM
jgi:hypothetical protein